MKKTTPIEADKQYNLYDELSLLDTPNALPEQIIEQLFFKLMSPFLPVHVLGEEEMKIRINRIRQIVGDLSVETSRVLKKHGKDKTANILDPYSTIDKILATIPDADDQIDLVNVLRKLQSQYTAELLDCFGFLPKSVFDRDSVNKLRSDAHDSNISGSSTSKLKDLVPSWIVGKFDSLEALMSDLLAPGRGSSMRRKQLDTVPSWRRLNSWCQNSTQAAAHIQTTVLPTVERFLKVARTERVQSAVLGGIDSRHPIELVKMVLDPKNSKRQRFEAYRTLYIIISHFSLQSNPVFVAQQEVRARLSVLVGANLFDGSQDPSPMEVPQEVRDIVYQTEFKHDPLKLRSATSNPFPAALRARRVSSSVAGILSQSPYVGTNDAMTFDERGKTLESTTWKLTLKHLMYLKCKAICEGKSTNLPEKYNKEIAEKYINELRDNRDFTGVASDDREEFFRSKPVSLQGAIDDTVGMAFSINMDKPMSNYSDDSEKRESITTVFSNLAEKIVKSLGLKNVRHENYLWGKNGSNGTSSHNFRLYKIHGFSQIEVDDFVDGKPVKKNIMIPVEIQLRPVETQLRAHGDGETGVQRYKGEQMATLGEFISPGGVYGPAHSHPSFEELSVLLGST